MRERNSFNLNVNIFTFIISYKLQKIHGFVILFVVGCPCEIKYMWQ